MTAIYLLALTVPAVAQPTVERALDDLGGALASDLPDRRGEVRLKLYLGEDPGTAAVTARLAAAAAASGIAVPDFELGLLPEIDWVAESQAALPPIEAGRFFVYGSHVAERGPSGCLPLKIDANVAFGTGRHETTRGCLLALTSLARFRQPASVLDLGCGSGILALAAARLWPCASVLAADNDPDAVRVTRENARTNGLTRVKALASDGYRAAGIARRASFDLIVANILAGPLCRMASDTARHLTPGGRVILSGLLATQEREVVARHRAAGLALGRRWRLGEWSTLLLAKKGAAV